ncbi:2OG-Fe dioxygenase family protein [Pseudomonas sp. WC2]|uniref:2OG-Fe dioxygenase family protein n=1 Tax=Pseudomonas sp. WC2 TaxID=3424773 RepID=UPI003D32CC95
MQDALSRVVENEMPQFATAGFETIHTPPMSDAVMASFDNMPRDGHSLKRLREIRLSQYLTYNEEGQWFCALLPRRKYIQSAAHINLPEAGGVFRHREQLECDPGPLIASILDQLPVSRSEFFHVNVNQIRVIANHEFRGVTVPEGPHRDGHQYSVIVVARRSNVTGGETQIIDPQTQEIVHRETLGENMAVLIDDERYIHYATDIAPASGETGYRDIWVVEINKWQNRAYGPAHEARASQ